MKRLIVNILALASVLLGAASCATEDLPEAGAPRHQVTSLKAVPGDEEVQLSWDVPEGWNPTEYIVTYTESDKVTLRTAEKQLLVDGLTNSRNYIFSVQAVYGDVISGAVSAQATPTTSRFAVTDLQAEGSANMIILSWTTPSTGVLSYTLRYYKEGDEAGAKEVTIDHDKTSYTLNELENDISYTLILTANYPKGASDDASVKAMPALATPYFLSRSSAAVNQPIKFTFNTEGYPSATDIRWTFPDGTILTGTEVTSGISSAGDKQVTLTVTLGGIDKSWTVDVKIREYVLNYSDWALKGTNYEGFKGSCPVFSPDGGTVYDITFNKKASLYAFNTETGELRWTFTPSADMASYNPLTVNPVSGDIYFGTTTAKNFFAVTSSGALKWTFAEAGSMKSAAPAVSADGQTVFIGDAAGNIFAINATTGAKIWTAAQGSAIAGLIVKGNDELVAGSTDGTVKFYGAADGNILATLNFSAMTDISGFAVAADKKTVYVPAKTALGSFSLESRAVLVASFAVAENNLYEPVVAPNGNVFVGSKDGSVYCVKGDLSAVLWKYTHNGSSGAALTNAFNYSHPCVDTSGNFYITSGQEINCTYILSSDGKVKEQFTFGSDSAQKQMGGNNYLGGVLYSAFVGASGKNGCLIGRYVGGERASGWSTHGGDICGSCCVK